MINIFIFLSLLSFIIVTPNAIHALLALIVVFINFALVLFITNISFIGFAYILVYIGAICVLFLYIILLLHLSVYIMTESYNTSFLILCNLLFLIALCYININTSLDIAYAPIDINLLYMSDLQLFTSHLFITHPHYMLIGVFLLLLALFLSIFVSCNYLNESSSNINVTVYE